MTGIEFYSLYERNIKRLIEELESFREEGNLWKAIGAIKNPAGIWHYTSSAD